MTTKKLTAAEQYAELKRQRSEVFIDAAFTNEALKNVPLFEVKCPSGMTFKCRKLDAAFAAASGNMPTSLATQLADETANTNGQPATELTAAQKAGIAAAALMVRYICVEPRLIVGDVGNHKNAISVDMLAMDDFAHLSQWAQSGGGAAEGLKTFRSKR
jgi:hypothetical protein